MHPWACSGYARVLIPSSCNLRWKSCWTSVSRHHERQCFGVLPGFPCDQPSVDPGLCSNCSWSKQFQFWEIAAENNKLITFLSLAPFVPMQQHASFKFTYLLEIKHSTQTLNTAARSPATLWGGLNLRYAPTQQNKDPTNSILQYAIVWSYSMTKWPLRLVQSLWRLWKRSLQKLLQLQDAGLHLTLPLDSIWQTNPY